MDINLFGHKVSLGEFTNKTLARTFGEPDENENMLDHACDVEPSDSVKEAIATGGAILGGIGEFLVWGIWKVCQYLVNEPARVVAGGAETALKAGSAKIQVINDTPTIQIQRENGDRIKLTEESVKGSTVVYGQINDGVKELIPHTSSLNQLQSRCCNNVVRYEAMYRAHASINDADLDKLIKAAQHRSSQSKVGTENFDEVDLAHFNEIYGVKSRVVTVELLQDPHNISSLMETILRQKYMVLYMSDFLAGRNNDETKKALAAELQLVNLSPEVIKKIEKNYDSLFIKFKQSLIENLDQITAFIIEGDNHKSLLLIDDDNYQVMVKTDGIHLKDKSNNETKTLVQVIDPYKPKKGDQFHQLVMQINDFSESQYFEFARASLKTKYDQKYATTAGTDSDFIQSQLNVMIDNPTDRKLLLTMLDKKGSEITDVTVDSTQIVVKFKSGETINFANRAPTNNEYRGLALLRDLQKLMGTETTLKELILSKKGTAFDAIAMYILGLMRTQSEKHILGFKTDGPFDPRTKQFLLDFEVAGIDKSTSQAYFEGLWAQETKSRFYDQIAQFFQDTSIFAEDQSQLQEKNAEILRIVDLAYDLKDQFTVEVKTLNPSDPGFYSQLTSLTLKYARLLSDAGGNNMCFGFNHNTNSVVLKLNSGENHAEVKLFSFDEQTFENDKLLPAVLKYMPAYWIGSPPETGMSDHIDVLKKSPYFENSYTQFFRDAERAEINGVNAIDLNQRISTAETVVPDFVPSSKKAGLKPEDCKKLNTYLEILNKVNKNFSSEQKDMLFRLCSQTANLCPNGIGMNTGIFIPQNSGYKVTVASAHGGQLLLTVESKFNLYDPEGENEVAHGSYTGTTNFFIDRDGFVTKCVARISEPTIRDNIKLTYEQRFAIKGFIESKGRLEQAFKEYALNGTTDRELEWKIKTHRAAMQTLNYERDISNNFWLERRRTELFAPDLMP